MYNWQTIIVWVYKTNHVSWRYLLVFLLGTSPPQKCSVCFWVWNVDQFRPRPRPLTTSFLPTIPWQFAKNPRIKKTQGWEPSEVEVTNLQLQWICLVKSLIILRLSRNQAKLHSKRVFFAHDSFFRFYQLSIGFPYPKMSGMVKSQWTTRFQIAGGMSHFYILWLVVDLPLWKIWLRQLDWWNSSIWEVGLMKFPTEWENKIHVPNHQPVLYYHVGIAKIPTKLSNIIQLNQKSSLFEHMSQSPWDCSLIRYTTIVMWIKQ